MINTLKLLTATVLFLVAFGSSLSAEICTYVDLIVTPSGYYAPMPGQSKYVGGSYEADIKMNGKGVATAGCHEPVVGTLAAQWSHFPKGTLIEFPQISERVFGRKVLFIVDDTGGAIKGRKIDIFCGRGESAINLCYSAGNGKTSRTMAKVYIDHPSYTQKMKKLLWGNWGSEKKHKIASNMLPKTPKLVFNNGDKK
jgi:3D (Asp-Asp-Asp) domain-containing protein